MELLDVSADARREVRALLAIAVPSMVSKFCYFAISLTELSVMGHLGVDSFAAIAFAQMGMDLTTLLFLQGFNAGLNALCAQAFGAKNKRLLALYGHIALVMVAAMGVPLAMLWWQIGDVLALAGVHEAVVRNARIYSRVSILSLWPRTIFGVLSIFYQSQQIVLPTTAVNVVGVGFTMLLSVGLTFGKFGLPAWGIVGCPIGTAIALAIRLVIYVAYMSKWYPAKHTSPWKWPMPAWNPAAMKRLCAVGFPLAIGALFEYSQLQVVALFSAHIGSAELGTYNAIMELIFFATSPIYGIMNGAVTRIGKHLGSGKATSARLAAKITGICIVACCAIAGVSLLVFRNQIGHIFSTDSNVLNNFARVLPLGVIAYMVLAFFYYSMCVLQAQARSVPVMTAFFIGAWLVGVPMAFFLGLHNGAQSFVGIWIGLLCGYVVTSSIGFVAAYFRSDWDQETRKAVDRSKQRLKAQALLASEADGLLC